MALNRDTGVGDGFDGGYHFPAALQLVGVHVAFFEEAAGVANGFGYVGLVGHEGHVTDEEGVACAAVLKQAGPHIEQLANKYHKAQDFLFLGRGVHYPIALEGALKLKEISYIHAEGYPAGEMKHGPIALIDERMPVVAIAPDDHVFEKMIGNVQEAKARGGAVIAITSAGDSRMEGVLDAGSHFIVPMPRTTAMLTPIVMTIPLQLLAYHIAVRGGCGVGQARNLAKCGTVE